MKTKIIITFCVVIAVVIGLSVYLRPLFICRYNLALDNFQQVAGFYLFKQNKATKINQEIFIENFDEKFIVKEIGGMNHSNNLDWWLSSGAYFYSADGIGGTILGPLSKLDPRRLRFAISNPVDTDNGYYPQNIFRLVNRGQWQDFSAQLYFQIIADNLSDSPNRNASNGVLLFNRYQDSDNLYYTGVRVDGAVVIKKKIAGVYYTMAYEPLFVGETSGQYNRDINPNLLPKNVWLGLRSEVKTNSDGTVSIKVFIDENNTNDWQLVAEAFDDGESFGGQAFVGEGHVGIRTDFMDVQFNDYQVIKN